MLLKDKKEIEAWLKQYSIKNYELIEDDEYGYVVNTISDIYLNFQNLYKMEIKFNEINGNFSCNNNKLNLESLKYLPKEIISDYIDLFDNKELGNLQTMTNLKLLKKELKEIFQIQDDKNNLLKELPLKNKNKTISKI